MFGRHSRKDGRPSRRAVNGQKALSEGRVWSRGPPKRSGVVRSGREAVPEGRAWLEGLPAGRE